MTDSPHGSGVAEAASLSVPSNPPSNPDSGDHQRRTWELELLISGAVVFALLGVPGRLDDWFFQLQLHLSKDQYLGVFFAYYYLKLIAYALIVSFCTNLSIRAYWIGLVGLHKVFPAGVRWEKTKDGPISKQLQQSHPSLPRLIELSDKASSLVFSSSFLIVFVFVFSIVLIGGAGLIAWLISTLAFEGSYLEQTMSVLVALPLGIVVICSLFDKVLIKKTRESWEGKWYVKPLATILKTFFWITGKPLSTSIQQTLATHIPRKLSIPLFAFAFIGLLGFFVVNFRLQVSDRLAFHGYALFPDTEVERSLTHGHYENLRQADKLYRHEPVIQSDIIIDAYIKLFIPYSPRRHNRDLDTLCPDTGPLPQQGFSISKVRNPVRPEKEHVDQALECLGQLHSIFLNEEAIQPQFDFYARPDTGVRGIISYLPVDGLPPGRNTLRIEWAEARDDTDADSDEPRRVEYFIPFWL